MAGPSGGCQRRSASHQVAAGVVARRARMTEQIKQYIDIFIEYEHLLRFGNTSFEEKEASACSTTAGALPEKVPRFLCTSFLA
ncbi:hypothetical protein GUJ93_ZPchr0002g25570 [Zizania palustris]|uniref:Uncharacterized protein n=1 Tax=Zizania palustris TaxID=103762 RepID=A0A8J5RI11_ZIZPA|nr:hypothetical protein GUJ93_ZPchr0002g25570 [Zizania palustris]